MGLPLGQQVLGEELVHDGAVPIPPGIVAMPIVWVQAFVGGPDPIE
jgi:hypothetical protein